MQRCTLLSIKTGGCNEDCKYCAQSTRYKTFVKPTPMMSVDEVVDAAKRAKAAGSTRFCMGTAWRELGSKKGAFGKILNMVEEVNGMGLEVCCTLGMVNEEQARQLKAAGLTAYNHNLDTSREHYSNVISTRTYDDRLQTIKNVRAAGISVCCGGILGLGETRTDRVALLHELATMEGSTRRACLINALVPIEGTPMEEFGGAAPDVFQMARTIATARIIMPRSMVRLSAGRLSFSPIEQTVMFLAGANSIFTGDKLLTTANPAFDEDQMMFQQLGLKGTRQSMRALLIHTIIVSLHSSHPLFCSHNFPSDCALTRAPLCALAGKRAFKNPLKPPPGHIEEDAIEDITPPSTPPPTPPRMPPPSTPRPQPAMHAAGK